MSSIQTRSLRLAIAVSWLIALQSAQAADGSLRIVQALSVTAPSTKVMAGLVKAMGFERTVLVVTATSESNVRVSARNLPKVSVLPASHLNVADMLAAQGLLMTVDAVRGAEALWGGERVKPRRGVTEDRAIHE